MNEQTHAAVETPEVNEWGTNETLAKEFPEHLRTEYTEVDLRCPKCNAVWSPPVARFVNVKTHPAVREGILRKTMHVSRCPACKGHEYDINQIWDYYDPDEGIIVQIRPRWEYKAGGGEKVYLDRVETLVLKYQEDDVRVDVVFGFDEMIERYLGGQEAVDAAMRRREHEIKHKLKPGVVRAENEHEYFEASEMDTV